MSLAQAEASVERAEASDEFGASLGRDAWRRLRRSPTAVIGAILVVVFVLVAIFAPLTSRLYRTR